MSLPDYTLVAWMVVFAIGAAIRLLPGAVAWACRSEVDDSAATKATNPAATTSSGTAAESRPIVDDHTREAAGERRGGCCSPICCGLCAPLGSPQRCFGVTRCCSRPYRFVGAVACELAALLVFTYVGVGILLLIGVYAAGNLTIFANVAASSCQAAPCTASDPAACCSYTVDPARFPNATQPTSVYFSTADGEMHAWYFTNSTPASPNQPWLDLLYHHGSGANIAVNYRLDRYAWLLARGRVRLFVYDYPGYGRSDGSPSEDGTAAAATGAAATFRALLNRTDDSDITYIGRSLGGAVAMRAISTSQSTRLVLQSTFLSWGGVLGGLFPTYRWAMVAGFQGVYDNTANAATFKQRTGACAYQSHSRADEWVPFPEAEELSRAILPTTAGSDGCTSRFYVYDTALHDDPLTAGEKAALGSWIAQAR